MVDSGDERGEGDIRRLYFYLSRSSPSDERLSPLHILFARWKPGEDGFVPHRIELELIIRYSSYYERFPQEMTVSGGIT